MARRPAAALLAAAFSAAAAGCAAQADMGDLMREQRILARRLADTRADLESLRVAVSRLQGRVDDLSGSGRSARVAPVPDVASRLQPLDQPPRPVAPPPAPVESPPPVWPQDRQAETPPAPEPPTATFGTPMTAPAPVSDDVPRDVDVAKDLARGGSAEYRAGLEAYQRGDYPKAIQALRGFATREPKSDLVPIARYWIGESYFAQRRYNEAILSYNEILVGAPKSERVPAALLRQAAAFFELGDKIDARLILQKLVADHPGSEEAAAAKRKLLVLGA